MTPLVAIADSIVIALIGIPVAVLTVLATLLGVRVSRLTERRLGLEAAGDAAALISPPQGNPSPETTATALLSLADLNRLELSIALLKELWPGAGDRVSNPSAILLVDKALRSRTKSSQRLAAELLWYEASRLDARRATDWPSCIDGRWARCGWVVHRKRGRVPTKERFWRWPRRSAPLGPLTRLFLFDAMLKMTLTQKVNRNTLSALAVRVYRVQRVERDSSLRQAAREVIGVIVDAVEAQGLDRFLHADVYVDMAKLRKAAKSIDLSTPTRDPILMAMRPRLAQLQQWMSSGQPVPDLGEVHAEDRRRFAQDVTPGGAEPEPAVGRT